MRKLFLVFAVMAMPAFIFAAGGGQQQGTPAGFTTNFGAPGSRISYPMRTDVTLTYWIGLTGNLQAHWTNFGDTPSAQGWMQRTGVKLEVLHPPTVGGAEAFNLMIASREFPDIIDSNWLTFPGGPERAIEEGIIMPLNQVMEYYAPYFSGILSENPEWNRMVRTDDGNYYVFPRIRGDAWLCMFNGIYVRHDWLNTLGMEPPVTFDDWTAMLTAFRDRMGSTAPLTMVFGTNNFVRGLGIDRGFFIGNNGQVLYGEVQPQFRTYLEIISRWYRDGLLDLDFISQNAAARNQKMITGVSGASAGNLGAEMQTWTVGARNTTPNYLLIATNPPVLRRGDHIVQTIENPFTGLGGHAISTQNRHVEISGRFLDWGYGPEGHIFQNFGEEGVAHTLVNGQPIFTDYLLNHPGGWSRAQIFSAHTRASWNGPMIQDRRYEDQYLDLPEQVAAKGIWLQAEPFRNMMPPVTPTQEESREFAQIVQSINTYANEMISRFILGTEPLSNFDAYVDQINRLGLPRALEIQTAALERYRRR